MTRDEAPGPSEEDDPISSAESDAWNVAEGASAGKPSLLRYRPGLKALLGDDRYPRVLVITWSYEETNSSGMPSDSQAEEMRGFEDVIQSCVDEDRLGILAFVRTGTGTRTLYYYVSDIAEVGNRINAALEPGLPVQLTVQDDPEWHELRNVYAACGEKVSG